jgi:1,4-dihydroxy-2-naphthoyl-CoA hydrolase
VDKPIQSMVDFLGIETCEMLPDKVVMKMPVTEKTKQPFGYLHGGASVVLAETVASIGTWLNIDQERQAAFGLEINANHIRPKKDGVVIATGVPVHKGRTTYVWDIRICDESDRLICISRCTVAVVDRNS